MHEGSEAARLIRSALSHYRTGDEVEALVAEILKTSKATFDALHMLGTKEGQAGNDAEAEKLFRHALVINNASAETFHNLGLILQKQGKLPEAIDSFRKAIEVQPGFFTAHYRLGKALQEQGNLSQAIVSYERAIELNPEFSKVYGSYSTCRKFTTEDKALAARLEKLLGGMGKQENQCSLHFALGKIYNDMGRYDDAFLHYLQANKYEQSRYPYHHKSFTSYIDRMIRNFPAGYFGNCLWTGSPSELPIFIVGMPRSGTTLIEQILSSHPLIFGAGELTYFNDKSTHLARELKLPYAECLEMLTAEGLKRIAEEYIGHLRSFGVNAERITNKMPGNFLHLGFISLLFPKARVIHCRRNPLDTCLSIFFQQFSGNHPYSSDLSNLGHYYRDYERLMDHWLEVLPAGMMFDIQYDELVEKPEEMSRSLIEFCGLPWSERCLKSHENERPVQSASSWQVRQPIYRTSKERWKRYEKYLGPLIKALEE